MRLRVLLTATASAVALAACGGGGLGTDTDTNTDTDADVGSSPDPVTDAAGALDASPGDPDAAGASWPDGETGATGGDIASEAHDAAAAADGDATTTASPVYAIKQGAMEPGATAVIPRAVITAATEGWFVMQVTPQEAGYAGVPHSAVFVHDPTGPTREVGEAVRVTATVADYFGQWRLEFPSVEVLAAQAAVPAATFVEDAGSVTSGAALASAYEGLLVRVKDVVVVEVEPDLEGPIDRELLLASGLSVAADLYAVEPLPDVGHLIPSVSGVLGWSWGRMKLLPRDQDDVVLCAPACPQECEQTCACSPELLGALAFPAPAVDAILVIDNSGDMGEEIAALLEVLWDDFAGPLSAWGVDFRVILLSGFGAIEVQSVCVTEPLGGIVAGGCEPPPPAPVDVPSQFHHEDVQVASHSSLCVFLDSLAEGDWSSWLRPEARKVVIELSTDGAHCTTQAGLTLNDADQVAAGALTADVFRLELFEAAPTQFGASFAEQKLRWHSIIGVAQQDPQDSTLPGLNGDPIQTATCVPGGVAPGTAYQVLSAETGGLRFSSCAVEHYGSYLSQMAALETEPGCEQDVEGAIDPEALEVTYLPTAAAGDATMTRVAGLDACTPDGWYLQSGTRLVLCPDACAAVRSSPAQTVTLWAACP